MIDDFLEELKHKNSAIFEEKRKVSIQEFVANIEAKSKLFDLKKKRILFCLDRSIDSIEWFFAFLKADAILFITNPAVTSEKLMQFIDYVQPHAIYLPNFLLNSVQVFSKTNLSSSYSFGFFTTVTGYLDPLEEKAQIGIFTSGTTGSPKAVLHEFSSLVQNAHFHARAIGLEKDDFVGSAMSLYFSYSLVAVLLSTLLKGASLYLAPPFVLGDALPLPDNISLFSTTPLLAKKMKAYPFRLMTIGGDVTPPALAKRILEMSPSIELFSTYGLTEAGPRVATYRIRKDDLDLPTLPLGEPLSNVKIEIANDHEIKIQTPTAMLGYFRNPSETETAYQNGWLYTGDLARKEEGEIFFLGRKKRLISIEGKKIYPAEIENLLHTISGVEDAYVMQNYSEIVAFVQTKVKIDPKTIISRLRKVLPKDNIPDVFHLVESLPQEARKK